jgi:DNA repair protein RecO (recombination protein O)
MSREVTYLSIILKKQPYNEGDELITVFTKEAGKLRLLAKSVKLQKAKLQSGLQQLFLVKLTLALSNLPKIIGAEVVKPFMGLRENLAAVKRAFYASELVLKFTPDEQKNEALFNLLREFFSFLNSGAKQKILDLALAKFKINILQTLGLDISTLEDSKFFSNSLGGFGNRQSADARQVHEPAVTLFTSLKDCRFDYLHNIEVGEDIHLQELQNLLSQFVEYQLERKVLSEGYLNHVL